MKTTSQPLPSQDQLLAYFLANLQQSINNSCKSLMLVLTNNNACYIVL
jgi:hypothetical protein